MLNTFTLNLNEHVIHFLFRDEHASPSSTIKTMCLSGDVSVFISKEKMTITLLSWGKEKSTWESEIQTEGAASQETLG